MSTVKFLACHKTHPLHDYDCLDLRRTPLGGLRALRPSLVVMNAILQNVLMACVT